MSTCLTPLSADCATEPLRLLAGDRESSEAVSSWAFDVEPEVQAPRIVARRRNGLVFIEPKEVWAFESDSRLRFVHCAHGRLDIEVSLSEIEASQFGHLFVRVHKSWLVNLGLVKALDHAFGETRLFISASLGMEGGVEVPVARDRARAVRKALLSSAIGVRRKEGAALPKERSSRESHLVRTKSTPG